MILDYIIVIMLLMSIIYTWRLNKKIVTLQNTRHDITLLIQNFDDAILRAEISISELKTVAYKAEESLQSKINKAGYLTNDLAFMTDRAASLSEKLEKDLEEMKESKKLITKSLKIGQRLNIRESLRESYDHKINEKLDDTKINEPIYTENIENKERLSIETLIEKISEVQKNNNLEKNSNIVNSDNSPQNKGKSQLYKPSILRQKEYFESLRKL